MSQKVLLYFGNRFAEPDFYVLVGMKLCVYQIYVTRSAILVLVAVQRHRQKT